MDDKKFVVVKTPCGEKFYFSGRHACRKWFCEMYPSPIVLGGLFDLTDVYHDFGVVKIGKASFRWVAKSFIK